MHFGRRDVRLLQMNALLNKTKHDLSKHNINIYQSIDLECSVTALKAVGSPRPAGFVGENHANTKHQAIVLLVAANS